MPPFEIVTADVLTFAYADPPYIGQAKAKYADHPDYAGEVDHRELIGRLHRDFPDGWSLSCSSPSLPIILGYCAEAGATVRIAAWVKPWAVWLDRNVAYAWEPVIFEGGRRRGKARPTAVDWVMANAVMKRNDDPHATKGTKPEKFCFWLFDLLGMESQDTLIDLFPGSGAVTKALEQWRRQQPLWSVAEQGKQHASF
jgi:hypothetical protein